MKTENVQAAHEERVRRFNARMVQGLLVAIGAVGGISLGLTRVRREKFAGQGDRYLRGAHRESRVVRQVTLKMERNERRARAMVKGAMDGTDQA